MGMPDSGRAMAIQVRAPIGLKIGIRFPYTYRYTKIDSKRILPYTDKYIEIKMGYALHGPTWLKLGIRFPYTGRWIKLKIGQCCNDIWYIIGDYTSSVTSVINNSFWRAIQGSFIVKGKWRSIQLQYFFCLGCRINKLIIHRISYGPYLNRSFLTAPAACDSNKFYIEWSFITIHVHPIVYLTIVTYRDKNSQ
jgi:hypothetical protein